MATRRYLPTTNIINNHDQIELHCANWHCPVHNPENANGSALIFESDEFRMYSFKVLMCHKTYSHDWTSCPYTHRGERARRRPPCRYLPIQCPYFKGNDDMCRRGNSCKLAHGIFEYWLHPVKYRTAMCTNGSPCDRKVCFFAHTPEELRDEIPNQRYLALSSNVEIPVAVPPRHALKLMSDTNYAPVSPYISQNIGTLSGFDSGINSMKFSTNGTNFFTDISQSYGTNFGHLFESDGINFNAGECYDAILPNTSTNIFADASESYGPNFGNLFVNTGINFNAGELDTYSDPILANTGINYTGISTNINCGGASASTTRYDAGGMDTVNFANFGTPSNSTFNSSLPDLSSLPYNFSGLKSLLKEIEEQGTAAAPSTGNNGYNQPDVDWSLTSPFYEWDEDDIWK